MPMCIKILVILSPVLGVRADLFGAGENGFSMEFITIGAAGNAADTATGYGAVDYEYRIARHEVAIDQFQKDRAADSRIGNGNEIYWNDGTRMVGASAPVTRVSTVEAAKFCNWLTSGDAHDGAYIFDDAGDIQAVNRGAAVAEHGMVYVLPLEDEWYKAAYFSGGSYYLYSTETGLVPEKGDDANYGGTEPWLVGSGSPELNGTFDMMGNVSEVLESGWGGVLGSITDLRVRRGGEFGSETNELAALYRLPMTLTGEVSNTGFRVAAIPEPSTVVLVMVGSAGLYLSRQARHGPRYRFSERRYPGGSGMRLKRRPNLCFRVRR